MESYFSYWFPDDEGFLPGVENEVAVPLDDLYIAQIEATLLQPITELLSYGIDLHELTEYVVSSKTICEFSYELQNCIFDLFPRWYIAQTPDRREIYPDIPQPVSDSHF
jgi:hypothetical protein